MAHGKPRDPRKEQQWQRWIQLWMSSGLTVWDFCARSAFAACESGRYRSISSTPKPRSRLVLFGCGLSLPAVCSCRTGVGDTT
jgi:hypothetical protein